MAGIRSFKAKLIIVGIILLTGTIACNFPSAQNAPTATLTATSEATDTPASTATPQTATPGATGTLPLTPTQECAYGATFVADVTIPDGTVFDPGESFVKTWRLKNNGCKEWDAGTRFVFVQGDLMGGPAAGITVPATAVNGQQDLSVTLVAPAVAGTYRGYWQLRASNGTMFGTKVYVDIVVAGGATPAKADLVITNITPDGDIIDEEPFTFNITVKNQGGTASAATQMGCELVGAGAAGYVAVPALAPDATAVVQCGYTVDAGDYTFSATVDIEDDIDEADETNNVRTYDFTAYIEIDPGLIMTIMPLFKPDLIVTAASADGGELTVWIKNQGLANAPASVVYCEITDGVGGDSNAPSGTAVPAIPAGQSVSVVCMDESYDIEDVTVNATADYTNIVTESNETNNNFSTVIS